MLEALAWKDIFTIATASVGAVLGVLNYWNQLSQRRVRLVVRPAYAHSTNGGPTMFAIEVTNLSAFAVTVTEVGLTGWSGAKGGARSAIVMPIVIDNKPWPRRLEPRSAVSGYFDPRESRPDPKKVAKAYAKTECGAYVYGHSPALRQLKQIAAEIAQQT